MRTLSPQLNIYILATITQGGVKVKKQLHVNEVIDRLRGPDEIVPVSINFEDILSYKDCTYGDETSIGKTYIRVTSNDRGYLVTENYNTVRKMMEDLRLEDLRPCYRVKIGTQVHYVPKNEVEHIAIDEENSHTTLILKSGDKIKTNQTMIELRESAIEIPF